MIRWIKQLLCWHRTGHCCPSRPIVVYSYPGKPIRELRLCVFCNARQWTERPAEHY